MTKRAVLEIERSFVLVAAIQASLAHMIVHVQLNSHGNGNSNSHDCALSTYDVCSSKTAVGLMASLAFAFKVEESEKARKNGPPHAELFLGHN